MADNRSRLEKLVGMLGSEHEGEMLNALRFIKKIAAEEKKTLAELLLSDRVVYHEKIVYRDAAPPRGEPREDVWAAKQRAQDARYQQRQDRYKAEQEANQRRREEKYARGFDDAEMSDDQRAEARRQRRPFRNGKDLLLALERAMRTGQVHIDSWHVEFATDVLARYSDDFELSERQIREIKKILAKIKAATEESPV